MNAERLLTYYGKVADAPDAVDQLRQLILESAIRGNLVPQDPEDAQVPDLDSDLSSSFARPFQIPKTWRWVRLQKLGKLKGGGTPSKARDDFWTGIIPWVSPKDMKRDYITEAKMSISDEAVANTAVNLIETGSILFVVRGMILAHSFPVALTLVPLTINQDMKAFSLKHPEMGEFILRTLKGLKFEMLKRVQRSSHGTCRLEGSDYSDFLIPFPPPAEQNRIVAKVDELTRLCDRLEAARVGREAVRDRLAMASLARLAAPALETFQTDARFILDTLPVLTARPDQIKAVRQTILNLAITGYLSTDWRAENPENGEAAQIVRGLEEAHLQNGGHRRGNVAFATDGAHDLVSENLPQTWSLTELKSAVHPDRPITYGILMPGPDTSGGVPYVRVADFPNDRLNLHSIKRTTHEIEQKYARARLAPDDILLSIRGTVGRTCLVPKELSNANITQDTARLSLQPSLDRNFVLLVLRAPNTQSRMQKCSKGVAVRGINIGDVRAIQLPIPPLAEQHRIVAKVDALMSLCDRLEAALVAADSARARLLDALLAEALAPANDSSGATTVEPVTAAASPGAAVTTERSAFVLSLAYERHRSAHRDRTFGHVKAEKILHLVEAEAGLDLGRAPIRDAAGPNDFGHLLGVDRWAKQHRRFAFDRRGKGYTFERLADFRESLETANTIDAPTRARVEKIVDLFVPMDTEAAELFATLYAAWNNLLIEGKSPDDADILQAAREDWHPDKLKIPRDRFAAALRHLKASEFVPSGRGKFVPPAPQRDLFLGQ